MGDGSYSQPHSHFLESGRRKYLSLQHVTTVVGADHRRENTKFPINSHPNGNSQILRPDRSGLRRAPFHLENLPPPPLKGPVGGLRCDRPCARSRPARCARSSRPANPSRSIALDQGRISDEPRPGMTRAPLPQRIFNWPFTVDGWENAASKDQSDFHAIGTDRWSRNREKPEIRSGDMIHQIETRSSRQTRRRLHAPCGSPPRSR